MGSGPPNTVRASCLLLLATPGLHILSNRASVFKQVFGQEASRGVRQRMHIHTKPRDRFSDVAPGGIAVKYGIGDKEERGTP